ncbi:amino acid synthesis family protein [Roseobacter sp. YSTF-M11]|uniref:Amino acid synthesis family protein n=1 Tax=Roseobacter insulae TaxID=2859783 RepID=A0A9X1K3R3_9RHOB|nr:amino acid synthesis family protein [Roseobacter insulae]MBW4709813.1 amino acid synthesis family protein [Roseobacter insulae]
MDVRKTIFTKEIITADEMGQTCAPITRVAAMAVFRNPFAGIAQTDLSGLFDTSAQLGQSLTEELLTLLDRPPLCYGKAALVGASGAMEHGAAVLHPALGKPVRAAIGGGASLMPSNHKVGAVGASIDLPLGHKDEAWSFDHIDTMTLCVPDAPRADEILLCIGLSDGPRAHPRVGRGPSRA